MRVTTAEDLPAISALTELSFGRRRSEETLRWLLLSEVPGLAVQSRVLISEGRVVGHGATLESRYQWGSGTAVGGHPMLWMLEPKARGILAISLGRWCTQGGDFSLVVGGTPKSKPIMERRRFVPSASTTELRLPTAGAQTGGSWELRPWEPSAATLAPTDGSIVNLAAPAQLEWLAACPRLESRLFSLYREGRNRGPVLLYVNRRNDPPTGRIVHLPWTGSDAKGPMATALGELAAAGCVSASILATSSVQLDAALALGGDPYYERLIYFRNQTGLSEPATWHLSYLEGDLAYRRV